MHHTMACACIRSEGIRGTVTFRQKHCGLEIVAQIQGLTDGFHGFHIHSGGTCENSDGRWNLENAQHPDHAGDLPSLLSCGGRACMTVWTGRMCLSDILGRTVVIHERRDDFTTQPSGDSGAMIACGVIECCK